MRLLFTVIYLFLMTQCRRWRRWRLRWRCQSGHNKVRKHASGAYRHKLQFVGREGLKFFGKVQKYLLVGSKTFYRGLMPMTITEIWKIPCIIGNKVKDNDYVGNNNYGDDGDDANNGDNDGDVRYTMDVVFLCFRIDFIDLWFLCLSSPCKQPFCAFSISWRESFLLFFEGPSLSPWPANEGVRAGSIVIGPVIPNYV